MTENCDSRVDVKIARLEEKLAASDRALELARQALGTWQAASNEWRQENIDQRAMYMTTDKATSLIQAESSQRYALEARVRVLEDSNKSDTGRHGAFNTTWIVIAFIITTAISIVTVILVHHP
jgi:hypothetical protein